MRKFVDATVKLDGLVAVFVSDVPYYMYLSILSNLNCFHNLSEQTAL